MRSDRGRTELVDRRLQVTDHKEYGVELWHELLLGAQHGERAGHPHKVVLKERAALAVYSWWASVEGGFGEDDIGSTMLTPGHVRGLGRGGQTSES